MKVSIVVPDGMVVVNGVSRKVDLSDVAAEIRAFQWYGSEGEIERVPGPWPVERFTSLSRIQAYLDRWQAAEPPPPPPPPVLTLDEQIDRSLSDRIIKAALLVLAEKAGMTPTQFRDAVKAKLA